MERSDLMIKSLAVYCGAHLGNDPIYQARAAAFGKKMAQNGIELVYGGGKYGTMGVIANAVLDNGGKVMASSPDSYTNAKPHWTALRILKSFLTWTCAKI
jgi:predicted Rossmann-fold nucleotide-binding protein